MAHQVLIDTNVLVYRFDSSELEKQEIATVVLREKLLDGTARLPHPGNRGICRRHYTGR